MTDCAVTVDGRLIWRVTPSLAVELDPWFTGKLLVHAGRFDGMKAILDVSDVGDFIAALNAAVAALET